MWDVGETYSNANLKIVRTLNCSRKFAHKKKATFLALLTRVRKLRRFSLFVNVCTRVSRYFKIPGPIARGFRTFESCILRLGKTGARTANGDVPPCLNVGIPWHYFPLPSGYWIPCTLRYGGTPINFCASRVFASCVLDSENGHRR